MTLIAAGQGLRKRADAGYSALANIEARENQMRTSVEMAQKQQETSMLGTGAGIGASYGLKAARAAASAAPQATSSIALSSGVPTTSVAGGTISPISMGGNLANIGGAAEAGQSIVNLGKVAELGAAGVEGAAGLAAPGVQLGATGGATVGGAGAAGAGAAGAGAGAGAAGGATGAATGAASGAAAGGGGAMAGLSALAAPVAIGLGVAFLLNKLFD